MHHRELTEGERVQERRPPEPAPLPLHALLALQQSAGNQAVGARARAPEGHRPAPQRLRQVGAMAGKTGATTADALLLAMCNALRRITLKPAPGAMADADAAITALMAVQPVKFDAEDETAFAQGRERQVPRRPTAAQAARRRRTRSGSSRRSGRTAPEVERKFSDHIFKGDLEDQRRARRLPLGQRQLADARGVRRRDADGRPRASTSRASGPRTTRRTSRRRSRRSSPTRRSEGRRPRRDHDRLRQPRRGTQTHDDAVPGRPQGDQAAADRRDDDLPGGRRRATWRGLEDPGAEGQEAQDEAQEQAGPEQDQA